MISNTIGIDDIEHLYSPSQWSKRYKTSEECQAEHVKFITERSLETQRNIPGDLNVAYGQTPKEKYDLFGTDLPDDAPIVFYIHGGYWQEEVINRNNASFIATVFHQRGVKVFIIGYELCPNVEFEVIIKQIQSALRICSEYAERRKSRGIFLIGHSAGAHLVAQLFVKSDENLSLQEVGMIKSAFLLSGVYDLEPLLQTSYNNPLKLTPQSAAKWSPMKNEMTNNIPKLYIIVGDLDSPAFVSQSKKFHEVLNYKKHNTELMILENIDHFDIMEKLTDSEYTLTKLILKTIEESI